MKDDRDIAAFSKRQAPDAPIAVIGMGCLFPGSDGLEAYWATIKNRRDMIGDIPEDHWRIEDYYDADPKAKDKTYGRRGGFLSPVEFEPLKYGIVPKDISAIDTTQLLALVAASQALDSSGYSADGPYDHRRTSVMLGVTGALKMVVSLGARLAHPQLRKALADSGLDESTASEVLKRFGNEFTEWQENSFPGLLGNVTAGRIANRLNLGGANLVVDAACASSLAAIRQAVMELQSGRADLVVGGGVDTFSDPFMYTCFSKTPALSPTGDAKAYDQDSDGTMLGEGLGILVMKRLDDAERDGDHVLAVIRGIGASSDGKGTAIFAPAAEGQIRALEDAYQQAGLSPATVELVEGHGTGTAVGDAVEVEALSQVFNKSRPTGIKTPWCALGSVKSQIGHTKAAAGAAGLIKAILALQHKIIPPTIKVKTPLPVLNTPDSPLYVNAEPRPWLANSRHPRRAGVSAFGFGGSNFHCVLEEYKTVKTKAEASAEVELLSFSGSNLEDLQTPLNALAHHGPVSEIAARSRAKFNPQNPLRLVMAAGQAHIQALAKKTLEVLTNNPQAAENDFPAGVFWGRGTAKNNLGFMFPAPENAYQHMFAELTGDYPEMSEAFSEAARKWAENEPESPALGLILYPPRLANISHKNIWAGFFNKARKISTAAIHEGLSKLLARFGLAPAETAGFPGQPAVSGYSFNNQLTDAASRNIKIWLELGPGQSLCQAASQTFKEAIKALPLDLSGGGHFDLARFLGRLAAWGLPVDFKAWPEKQPFENNGKEKNSFSIPLTGANHFLKKVIPPSPLKTLNQATPDMPYGGNLLETLEQVTTETAKLHQKFLSQQKETLKLIRHNLGNAQEPLAAEKITTTATVAVAPPKLELIPAVAAKIETQPSFQAPPLDANKVLEIISAETGYPLEMLNQDMDLEVDLGLDSIKKVEIMAALAEKFPHMPEMEAEAMTSIATLKDLIALTGSAADNSSGANPAPKVVPAQTCSPVWPVLLKVTASETGYPEEMLRPDMSLTDDLGLDSIKLVEIVSLLTEELNIEPDFSADIINEAATLGQLAQSLEKVSSPCQTARPSFETAYKPDPPVQSGHAADNIDILMAVLVHETGYPRDMLNLEMSLEADLGLDSIKKVEIMAALADRLPHLESLGAAENISTVETLRDLATLVSGPQAAATPPPTTAPQAPAYVPKKTPEGDLGALLLAVVAAETGYPVEMLSWEAALEADLGLDSIKRVEIMAAVSEKLGDAQIVASAESLNEVVTLNDLRKLLNAEDNPAPASYEARPEPPSQILTLGGQTVKRRPGRPPKIQEPAVETTIHRPEPSPKNQPAGVEEALHASLSTWQPAPVDLTVPEARPEPPSQILTLGGQAVKRRPGRPPKIQEPTVETTEHRPEPSPKNQPAGVEEALHASLSTWQPAPVDLTVPLTGQLEDLLPRGSNVWLMAEPSPLTTELSSRLTSLSHRVTALSWHGQNGFNSAAAPEALIMIWPGDSRNWEFPARAFKAIKAAEPHFKASLANGKRPLAMGLTFMGGSFALSGKIKRISSASGSLPGLIKTLPLEWTGVNAKAVDLPLAAYSAEAAQFAPSILKAALAPAGTTEIGLPKPETFQTLALAPYQPKAGRRLADRFNNRTILVTGGAKGVTAEVLKELAAEYRLHFIILGRTPLLPEEPDWLKGLNSENELREALFNQAAQKPTPKELARESHFILSGRELKKNIADMEMAGARVTYISGEMRQPAILLAALAEIKQTHGPIHGFIHGAGVLADSLINDKTEADFNLVFETKARMAALILEAFKNEPLKLAAFFSSSSARFGRKGQCDYAAGNEALNKMAAELVKNNPGLKTISVNWGPWAGGMVNAGLASLFAKEGIGLIPLKAGAKLFVELASSSKNDPIEIVVLGPGTNLAALSPA